MSNSEEERKPPSRIVSTMEKFEEKLYESDGDDVWEYETIILHTEDLGLGIKIDGGYRKDEPVYITEIIENSAAEIDGRLKVADVIVQVNGKDVKLHDETVDALRFSGPSVRFVVKRLVYEEGPSEASVKEEDTGWHVDRQDRLTPHEKAHNDASVDGEAIGWNDDYQKSSSTHASAYPYPREDPFPKIESYHFGYPQNDSFPIPVQRQDEQTHYSLPRYAKVHSNQHVHFSLAAAPNAHAPSHHRPETSHSKAQQRPNRLPICTRCVSEMIVPMRYDPCGHFVCFTCSLFKKHCHVCKCSIRKCKPSK